MIGFLAPALLALLAVAAVPILLHLLQRHQGRRVVFPAIRYLRLAEREHARRIRLRQLLLLLLRVAAIVALALAAARPFLRSGRGEHRPTALAIVLDNSLSTSLVDGDARVLDELKALALAATASAGPEDRFWLIAAAQPWEASPPGTAAEVADRIRAVRVVAGGADLAGSVERARNILAAGAEGRATEIHVLTDGQATEFTTPATSADGADPPLLVLARDSDAPANLGVSRVTLEGGLAPRAGQRIAVAVSLAGTGDSATLRLLAHDTLRAAGRGSAGAASLLALPSQPPGVLEGRVELDPDALRADDRRFFATVVLPPPAVALAGDAPFVDRALDILAAAGRVRRAAPRDADVLISAGGAGVGGGRAGAFVVIPPPDPVRLPALNRALATARIPWRVEALPEGSGDRAVVDGDAELHDVLADVDLRTPYALVPLGDAVEGSVRVRLESGAPWVVAGTLAGGRRYLLLAGALDGETGDVAGSAAMVPLLDRLVGGWATPIPEGADVAPGEPLPLPGRADGLVDPTGSRTTVEGGAPLRAPSAPGVYRVVAGDSLLATFAVNPPPRESDLTPATEAQVEAVLGAGFRSVSAEEWGDEIFQARRGREAWRWLAAAALILLLAEMSVAASGRGSRVRADGRDGGADATRDRTDAEIVRGGPGPGT